MKIKRIIVDRKPDFCAECPIKNSGIRTLEKDECGKMKTVIDGEWKVAGKAPDERCLLEIG